MQVNGYPNPAEDYIIIEHPFIKTNHTLTVYDLTGKIIQKQPVNNAANTRLTRQNISQSGHFFYSISDDTKVKQAGRFIFK